MDTNTTPNPTPFNPQDSLPPVEPIGALVPVPARPQRTTGEFRRFKLLATSAAIAGLTATGGLAVTLSLAATPAADTNQTAAAAPQATTAPATTTNSGTLPAVSGAQPPQRGPGGPGHVSTGGS